MYFCTRNTSLRERITFLLNKYIASDISLRKRKCIFVSYYISIRYNIQGVLFAQHLPSFRNFTFLHRENGRFCHGAGIFIFFACKIFLLQWKKYGISFQFLTVFSYLCRRNTSLAKKSFDLPYYQTRKIYGCEWDTEIKITANPAIAGNMVGLRQGVFPSFYRDFKIRLFALSTTEVSKEAR